LLRGREEAKEEEETLESAADALGDFLAVVAFISLNGL
jgi:NTP pyrophosphatase (non-canonical NTP hydrolase)